MRAAFALTLLLAGCGLAHRQDDADGIPPACRDQIADDPEVRALQSKAATNITLYAETRQPLRRARARATAACLRQAGTLPPGGVEERRTR